MLKVISFIVLLFTSVLAFAADAPSSAQGKNRDYILGAGDLVRVSVYGSPDMLTEARLSASGTITFPLVGAVALAGLSSAQSEKKLAKLLEDGGFLKNPQVNLVVVQFQSQYVSVLGDVNRPGKYPLDRPSKLTDALAFAGGVNGLGSDLVTLVRTEEGKTTHETFDIRELIAHADTQKNPMVTGDDIIYVNAREVSILGQVNRPGKYSVIGGVRTLLDFLSQAGGISAGGSDVVIVLTKRDGQVIKHEIDVDLLFKKGDASVNLDLTDGDSVYVPRTPVFYIYGEVQRPGSFRLERNMNVAQALSVGGGLSVRGTERSIKVKRQVGGQLKTIDVTAGDAIQADDIVFVRESLF